MMEEKDRADSSANRDFLCPAAIAEIASFGALISHHFAITRRKQQLGAAMRSNKYNAFACAGNYAVQYVANKGCGRAHDERVSSATRPPCESDAILLKGRTMQAAAAIDTTAKKLRSVLTNDPRRLAGVSMHTPEGRRFKDIVDAILVEFGGDADVTRVRELASLKFSHEMIQSEVIAGDLSKAVDLVRLSNLIARMERDLRRRKAARAAMTPPAHSLEAILARHRAADEAARKAAVPATPAAGDGDNGGER